MSVNLMNLYCDNNKLTHLPTLPNIIKLVHIVNNSITSLNISSVQQYFILACDGNNIIYIDNLPTFTFTILNPVNYINIQLINTMSHKFKTHKSPTMSMHTPTLLNMILYYMYVNDTAIVADDITIKINKPYKCHTCGYMYPILNYCSIFENKHRILYATSCTKQCFDKFMLANGIC